MNQLLDEGVEKVKSTQKEAKVNLKTLEKIIVPIHHVPDKNHWACLCVDLNKKTISYYDSLNGNGQKYLDAMEKYLKQIFKTIQWKKDTPPGTPQQDNLSDCGVFTCQFMKYLARNKAFDFQASKMPEIRQEMKDEIMNKS